MSDLEAFERECKVAARNMRRLPAEVRKALAAEVQPRVAVPLAAKVAASFSGPWADRLAAQTKARKLADPTVVVGGAKKVTSGGASARNLVFGATWGGGKRISTVTRRTPRGRQITYQAHVTKQFDGKGNPAMIQTLRAQGGWVLQEVAQIVDEIIEDV